MKSKIGPARRYWALVMIFLVGYGLRVYRIDAQSLWYDETVSVYLAGKSVPDLVAHTAGDIHPPGYYLLLHSWSQVTGHSAFAAAYLSVFFGMLLLPLAYWLGARVFGTGAGLLAAAALAVSPYNLWYSQEVRMYTLGAILGLGVLTAVILLVGRPSRASQWSLLAAYAICGALGLWVLYYFAFLLVAVNLMVAVWWLARRRSGKVAWAWLGRWALAQVTILILYSPWLANAWRQATEPPVPPWRGFSGLADVLVESWSALSLGQSASAARLWPVLLLSAVLIALGLIYHGTKRPSQGLLPQADLEKARLERSDGCRACTWILAGYVFIPVLLIYVASFITPLYHVRYVFTYSTPFYILLGAGLSWLWQRWRAIAGLALAVLVASFALSIHSYYTDNEYASDDHREAVRFLSDRWRPGDAVLVNAGYAYTALDTYWTGEPIAWQGRLVDQRGRGYQEAATGGPVVLLTGTVGGEAALGWGDPESDFYAMEWAEAEAALDQVFSDFDRVFVYRIYDTVTDEQGLIRDWLAENGTKFEDRVFTGQAQLRVQGFLTNRAAAARDGPVQEVALADGTMWLETAEVLSPVTEAGGSLDLTLDWRIDAAPDGDAILFAGLYDEYGHRWAQSDERPLGSVLPPGSWEPGTAVRTPVRVRVPAGTPPGRYRLEVGWYRFEDGQPVWLPWESGERLYIGDVDVGEPVDWWAVGAPLPSYSIGVTIGDGVQLVGFDALALEGLPGEELGLELLWQARKDGPQAGLAVLQLTDDSGTVLAESAAAPVGGRAPFARMEAGQSLRDPRSLALPGDLEPGVYNVRVGRRDTNGAWLRVSRGPFSLGTTYPLATLRVTGRQIDRSLPEIGQPIDVRLGNDVALVGYELEPGGWMPGGEPETGAVLKLRLFWQALGPMEARYKVFVHLIGAGGPSDIISQADVFPRLPTTAWIEGEYLSDSLALDIPASLVPGSYSLLVGLYEPDTGRRLPVIDAEGTALGDSVLLEEFLVE